MQEARVGYDHERVSVAEMVLDSHVTAVEVRHVHDSVAVAGSNED